LVHLWSPNVDKKEDSHLLDIAADRLVTPSLKPEPYEELELFQHSNPLPKLDVQGLNSNPSLPGLSTKENKRIEINWKDNIKKIWMGSISTSCKSDEKSMRKTKNFSNKDIVKNEYNTVTRYPELPEYLTHHNNGQQIKDSAFQLGSSRYYPKDLHFIKESNEDGKQSEDDIWRFSSKRSRNSDVNEDLLSRAKKQKEIQPEKYNHHHRDHHHKNRTSSKPWSFSPPPSFLSNSSPKGGLHNTKELSLSPEIFSDIKPTLISDKQLNWFKKDSSILDNPLLKSNSFLHENNTQETSSIPFTDNSNKYLMLPKPTHLPPPSNNKPSFLSHSPEHSHQNIFYQAFYQRPQMNSGHGNVNSSTEYNNNYNNNRCYEVPNKVSSKPYQYDDEMKSLKQTLKYMTKDFEPQRFKKTPQNKDLTELNRISNVTEKSPYFKEYDKQPRNMIPWKTGSNFHCNTQLGATGVEDYARPRPYNKLTYRRSPQNKGGQTKLAFE
ncbi:hypothetical protein Ahia01_000814400, partial [Argonauta hians]